MSYKFIMISVDVDVDVNVVDVESLKLAHSRFSRLGWRHSQGWQGGVHEAGLVKDGDHGGAFFLF